MQQPVDKTKVDELLPGRSDICRDCRQVIKGIDWEKVVVAAVTGHKVPEAGGEHDDTW